MSNPTLAGRRVAILVADGFETVELEEPRRALQDAGATVEIVSPTGEQVQGVDGMEPGERYAVDVQLGEADEAAFDALVLPGGLHSPDRLRQLPEAVQLVTAFVESGRPVAAICHGPWSLVEAGVLRDRTITSYPSLRTDVVNAGGTWVDEEVHVDGNLITSRRPDDLPAFCERLVDAVARDDGERRSAAVGSEQSFPASDPPAASVPGTPGSAPTV
jgi:protease I